MSTTVADSSQSQASAGLSDLARGFAALPTAWALAWADIVSRYRRTALGPFWMVAQQALWVGSLTFVFRSVFGNNDPSYPVYLAIGLAIWGFIASCLTGSADILVNAKAQISAYPRPFTMHVLKAMCTRVIEFGHLALVIVIAAAIFRPAIGPEAALFLPAALLYLVAGFGVSLILAAFGPAFRDLGPVVASATALGFIITPIMWTPNLLGDRVAIIDLNPLYHFIAIGRDPLLGVLPPTDYWVSAATWAAGLLAAGIIAFVARRRDLFFHL
jgi:lipopolysaccharide transport system permease protein